MADFDTMVFIQIWEWMTTQKPNPPLAGLLQLVLGLIAAAGASISLLWLFRRPMVFALGDLLPAVVGGYLAATLAAAALVAATTFMLQKPVRRTAVFSVVFQVATAGVWMAALLVLAGLNSRLLIAAAVGLSLSLATCLRAVWRPRYQGDRAEGVRPESHIIAVSLHGILAGELLGISFLTMAAAGVAVFVLTWLVAKGRPGLGLVKLAASAVLAYFLIFLPLHPGAFRRAAAVDRANGRRASPAQTSARLHSGVILELDHRRVTVLAPTPKVLHETPLSATERKSAVRIPSLVNIGFTTRGARGHRQTHSWIGAIR